MLFIIFLSFVFADTINYLQDIRSKIVLPSTSPQQQISLAKYAQNLFSIYVHKYLKAQDFGNETNVYPRLDALVQNAGGMDGPSFHTELFDIFMSVHDRHTVYVLPPPYACFSAQLGIAFDMIEEKNGAIDNPIPIVTSIDSELLNKSSSLSKVHVGDVLLSVQNMSFTDFILKNKKHLGGANTHAVQRRALDRLSKVAGFYEFFPTEDEVEFTFMTAYGQQYSVTLPWIATTDTDCYHNFVGPMGGLGAPTSWRDPGLPRDPSQLYKWASVPTTSLQKVDGYNKVAPGLLWRTYKNLGIIRLLDFKTPNYGPMIQQLLVKELSKMDALLIDIRDNPGGDLEFAADLITLFKSNPTSIRMRPLKNQLNDIIFNSTLWDYMTDFFMKDSQNQYKKTLPNETFGNPSTFVDPKAPPKYQISWKKPVAILTNANCYSACDAFTAMMQDNKAAVIIGEDGTTGGGGANMMFAQSFEGWAPDFFPHVKTFMRIAWRQLIRADNSMIEDVGVASQFIIRPSWVDVVNRANIAYNGEINQLNRIIQILKK